MKVIEAIKKRRSIRRFDHRKKITDKQIEKLLEAARWAPSAGNLQSRFLIAVRDRKLKRKLALAAFGQIWVAQAPLVFVFCADLKRSASRYRSRGRTLYAVQDATLAAQNLWLAATEMGLGGVWVGAFNEKLAVRVLKLKKHLRPIALLPIGYPVKVPAPSPRRSLNEIAKII